MKDYNLLKSCVVQIDQEVFRGILYPTIEEKISWIVFSIISNHIFLDGNKRTGVMTLEYLCIISRIKLDVVDDDLINLAFGIETSRLKYDDVVYCIRRHRDISNPEALNSFSK